MITRTRKEVIKRWTEALRSGKYEQGTKHLKQLAPDGKSVQFCCMGVLAELAQQDGGPAFETEPTSWGGTNPYRYGGENGSLCIVPQKWEEWLFPNDATTVSVLMNANDAGRSFNAISRMIEEMSQ
jgi:hypothetical protein